MLLPLKAKGLFVGAKHMSSNAELRTMSRARATILP